MAHDVTLKSGRFWREENILRGQAADGAEATLDSAREQVAAQRQQLDDGKPLPFLMDIRRARSLSREARNYFASDEAAQVFAATALLVSSPLSRAIGNFFLGLNKPKMQTRLFTDENEALAWLKSVAP